MMKINKINKGICFLCLLLLGLFVCFLLGSSKNREGMEDQIQSQANQSQSSTQLNLGDVFQSTAGGTIKVTGDLSKQTLSMTLTPNGESIILTGTKPNDDPNNIEGFVGYRPDTVYRIFYGPSGETATVVIIEGKLVIRVELSNGSVYIYSKDGETVPHYNYPTKTSSANVVTGASGNAAYGVTGPQGNTVYGTIGTDTTSNSIGNESGQVSGAYATGSNGNTVGYVEGPKGNSVTYASPPNGTTGISAANIPAGDEDLYILKSQIVPPVCPACPTPVCPSGSNNEKPPPCPACARCPEPSFECKKVPNYGAASNNNNLPMPVLSDFSSFGM
jgi:hypothetical protein